MFRGRVVWFSGLSGAGKTTICMAVAEELRRRGRHLVKILDGDDLRKGLCSDLGFSEEDRLENVRRIAHSAALLSQLGAVVLVGVICPFERGRRLARSINSNMIEVFVDAPLAVCEQRDPKGLYKRVRAGEITGFTGVDAPFEKPQQADVVCRTDFETISESSAKVLALLDNLSPEPRERKRVRRSSIAVDFDGVIADYQGWQGPHVLGVPRPDVRDALLELRKYGWKIVLHTTRGSDEIEAYLLAHSIPFDEINSNSDYTTGGTKPVATVYWDDRAVTYSGDAMRDLPVIRSFRTWNKRP